MISQKITSQFLIAAIAAMSLSVLPAWSDVTNADIVNAVESAHVLDPGTSVRVKVEGDKIYVAAYRNPAENDADCKINTVLIAKSVFAAAGDSASRVTIYYYGQDGASYAEVSVTAGDVKAFGAGATSQEQLLKSIVVEHKQQVTDADRITSRLANSAYLRPDYRVDLKPDNSLLVTTVLGDWVSDQDAKLEAVKIADIAADAAPAGVEQIKVSFMDPRMSTNRREVNFKKADVQSMWQQIQNAINGVLVAKLQVPIELRELTARSGPAFTDRSTVLNRIKDGDRLGIGMTSFVKAFMAIEAMVPSGDEAAIKAAVNRLQDSLNGLEKSYIAAKAAKFSKGNEDAAGNNGRQSSNDLGSDKLWIHGKGPFPPDRIASNPEGMIANAERICGGAMNADRDAEFLKFLQGVSRVLKADNNAAELAKVDARIAKIMKSGMH
ncbi:MAG TPA: hypothetical protein V6D22_02875 [Candidatus Obscuribacterales bacterium]